MQKICSREVVREEGGEGVNELILVSLITKGVDFDSKKVHKHSFRDQENLSRKHAHYFSFSSDKFLFWPTLSIFGQINMSILS